MKEPGWRVFLVSSRALKSFKFGVDVYDVSTDDRKYVASLSQLNGQPLGATVTDSTRAGGDSNLGNGNPLVGGAAPSLVNQGGWSLAAKYLQVSATTMTCADPIKHQFQDMIFSFDGRTIHASTHTFTQADSESGPK
jgi:hypothetical protein